MKHIKSAGLFFIKLLVYFGLMETWCLLWVYWPLFKREHPWKRNWPTRPMPFINWCEHATPTLLELSGCLFASTLSVLIVLVILTYRHAYG
jgi:hypothetical protein